MTRTWTPENASRGHVVALHGRGEHPGVYERFGRRLAAGGYTVVAPDRDSAPASWFAGAGESARVLAVSETSIAELAQPAAA